MIVDADADPLIVWLIVSLEVDFDQIGALLKLNRNAGHCALHLEQSLQTFVPEGQIVPEKSDVAKIVSLISRTQQSMVVEMARKEGLSRHIDEVVLHVELEVDFLVVAGGRFARLAEHQNLNRVLAWLQVHPDRF